MGQNLAQVNLEHHKNETVVKVGKELSVRARHVTENIDISGTSTSFKVAFEGKAVDGGNWYPIMGVNLSTLDLASEATANGIYQVSLDGLIKFRCNLTEIGNNEISVIGRVVD